MAYTISEKVYIGGMIVIFCMILMGCVFMAYAVSVWARNRKEDRIAYETAMAEKRAAMKNDQIKSWTDLLTVKDSQIDSLERDLRELKWKYNMTQKLLETSERERLNGGNKN